MLFLCNNFTTKFIFGGVFVSTSIRGCAFYIPKTPWWVEKHYSKIVMQQRKSVERNDDHDIAGDFEGKRDV